MKAKLKSLTDTELLIEKQKLKYSIVFNLLLIVVLIGAFAFLAISRDIDFFTLIPLYLVYFGYSNISTSKKIDREIKSRNL